MTETLDLTVTNINVEVIEENPHTLEVDDTGSNCIDLFLEVNSEIHTVVIQDYSLAVVEILSGFSVTGSTPGSVIAGDGLEYENDNVTLGVDYTVMRSNRSNTIYGSLAISEQYYGKGSNIKELQSMHTSVAVGIQNPTVTGADVQKVLEEQETKTISGGVY